MPLSSEEFDEACEAICPHCRKKAVLRQRQDTKEFVHDLSNGHAICWADGLRRSRFAEK